MDSKRRRNDILILLVLIAGGVLLYKHCQCPEPAIQNDFVMCNTIDTSQIPSPIVISTLNIENLPTNRTFSDLPNFSSLITDNYISVSYPYNESKPFYSDIASSVSLSSIEPKDIVILSYADSRGSVAYNDSLAQKRSESIIEEIVNQKVLFDNIFVINIGEREIQNECIDGVSCPDYLHQKNRRSDIYFLDKSTLDSNIKNAQIDSVYFQYVLSEIPTDSLSERKRILLDYYNYLELNKKTPQVHESIEKSTYYQSLQDDTYDLLGEPKLETVMYSYNFSSSFSMMLSVYDPEIPKLIEEKYVNNPDVKEVVFSVYFLDDEHYTLEQKQLVIKIANEWFADDNNIFFRLEENKSRASNSQIRIKTKDETKLLGKWAKPLDLNELDDDIKPNMALGRLLEHIVDGNQEAYRAVILHEFGHSIGLKHEQLHRSIKGKWNLNYMCSIFQKEDPDFICEKWSSQFIRGWKDGYDSSMPYDSLSVMQYPFPKGSLDGFPDYENVLRSELSELNYKYVQDKLIAKLKKLTND